MQHDSYFRFTNRLFAFVLCVAVLSGNFSVAASAQTRRRGAAKKPSKVAPTEKSPEVCTGNWTGTFNYSKTQTQGDSKTTPLISGRGEEKSEWHSKYDYEAKIVAGEVAPGSPKVGKATVMHSFSFNKTIVTKEKNSCDRGKTWREMSGTGTDKSNVYGASAVEADYNVGVSEDGTYSIAVGIPEIMGKSEGSESSSYSGQCTEKKGKSFSLEPRETRIDGNSITTDGTTRVNPAEPNRLSGSYTLKGVGGIVETVSWKLQRCGKPLRITGLKFYHALYPTPNSWGEITDDEYTIDGNIVKIVATVANFSGSTKTTNAVFKELKENFTIPESQQSVTVAPSEEKEIECAWDTSGFAWKEANVWNKSEVYRSIKIEITEDSLMDDVQVNPKPVVLVPGLWSQPEAFGKLGKYFNQNALDPWAVVYAPVYVGKTAAENAFVIEKTVRDLQQKENAWHVDVVAHSTGGLAARVYVNSLMPTQFDGRPTAAHLVMIGTPNLGTPCAGGVDNIFTRFFSRNADSLREVTVKNMRLFNQRITNRNGTKFFALVGNSVAPICQLDAPGDGITPNESAIWTIKDWKFSTVPARHELMPGEQANFMQIYKWLSVPPKGNHAPDAFTGARENAPNDALADSLADASGENRAAVMFVPASFAFGAKAANGDEDEPDFSTGIKLGANAAKEVEIPLNGGSKLSLVFIAPPKVSVILTNETGEIVGKNSADAPEAAVTFRTITVNKPFAKGVFKLKLESREQTESEIAVTVFVDYNSAIFEKKRPN